jgi:UDP-N-acetylglucosamine:LPS N-acetylglucosamine transferase
MSRSILIMAGGTGGHIFGSGITPAERALACTENAADIEVLDV